MTTKNLTGWLLTLGPILTFMIAGLLWQALLSGDAGQEQVASLMKNTQLSLIITSAGSVMFVATFIGLALLANSMNGGDQAGSAYAVVAGVIFVGLTAIGILSSGMNPATIEIASKGVNALPTAAIVDIVADGMFAPIFFYWGIGNILIGTAVVIQNRLHIVIGWLFVVVGIIPVLGTIVDVDIPDAVGMLVWIAIALTTAAAGVLTLKEK